jgi:hypothetical protein
MTSSKFPAGVAIFNAQATERRRESARRKSLQVVISRNFVWINQCKRR